MSMQRVSSQDCLLDPDLSDPLVSKDMSVTTEDTMSMKTGCGGSPTFTKKAVLVTPIVSSTKRIILIFKLPFLLVCLF